MTEDEKFNTFPEFSDSDCVWTEPSEPWSGQEPVSPFPFPPILLIPYVFWMDFHL